MKSGYLDEGSLFGILGLTSFSKLTPGSKNKTLDAKESYLLLTLQ